jgi:rSAM/selenodomain-associated transferase 2
MTTIAVVIPTWCEAVVIGEAVTAARAVGDEVIVVDAGSPDGTAEIATRAGARVVSAAKGRGLQLHAGALDAKSDVLLFLYADARLPSTARGAILRVLADARLAGGNFYLRFEPASPAARLFTWANDARRRWLDVYYGDSGLFVRRSVYEALGGYRPLPIMEDYDFIRRLECGYPTAYLRRDVVTVSARRFAGKPLRTLLRWALIQSLYSLGVPAGRLATLYADHRPATPRS